MDDDARRAGDQPDPLADVGGEPVASDMEPEALDPEGTFADPAGEVVPPGDPLQSRGPDDGKGFDPIATARKLNSSERLIGFVRGVRERLPGDDRYGDPLSTDGGVTSNLVGREIGELNEDRPKVLREASLGALQLWQALSEKQGRGRGEVELTILFTDLVEFSAWALAAGDTTSLDLLRDAALAVERPVTDRGGRVVKRLGDGMMAVFLDPLGAIEAVFDGQERLAAIESDGYTPHMRAGIHLGKPRHIGSDYLGVDVNVAARIAEHAHTDELLVSHRVLERVDRDTLTVRRRRMFRAKGVPKEIEVFSIRPAGD